MELERSPSISANKDRYSINTVAQNAMHDAEELAARQQLHDAIRQIPVLAPWTNHVAFEPSFSDAMNHELATRVQELVFDELEQLYLRLKKQQDESDSAGVIAKKATRTLLENRMVVEAKRRINLHQLTSNMKSAMKTAIALVNTPGFAPRRGSAHAKAWRQSSLLGQILNEKEAEKAAVSAAAVATATFEKSKAARSSSENQDQVEKRKPLYVEFPPSPPKLSELIDQADAAATTEDMNQQVTSFRHRPVSQSAVQDAGSPVSRRDVKPDRVRYIASTRLGVLPPTKNILEEYPIPKEILDALETHRHYHVDESSLMSSFDAIKAGGNNSSDWECYVRRSVPVERKPISFVLSSLEIAHERPVPPPSDIFQHHLLETATNDDIMLTEVRQLYDHTHDSYRDFRASLHRHLDLQYLVDLSFRSPLNSTSYFLDEEIVNSEASVQIPERLFRRAATSPLSKWRVAKHSAMGRINTRRGAIAIQVKAELSKAQRNELLTQICHFTPNEVQLMDLWYSYDADVVENTPFDPIPMIPELSNRLDVVWKDLSMPAKERLDLAIKYSSLDNSSRLPDAVLLWEVAAALIKEREELLRLVHIALETPKKTIAMIAEETALLQDLAQTTTHVKEALLLTYIEVGDFVTLSGNFYLIKMEHEAAELQQSIVESLEAAKHRGAPDSISEMASGHLSDALGSDRETAHRDTWV